MVERALMTAALTAGFLLAAFWLVDRLANLLP